MKFTNASQVKEKFVKDGWNENISFSEVTLSEAKEERLVLALNGIENGRKYFKMISSGDIFNDKGKIVIYNI